MLVVNYRWMAVSANECQIAVQALWWLEKMWFWMHLLMVYYKAFQIRNGRYINRYHAGTPISTKQNTWRQILHHFHLLRMYREGRDWGRWMTSRLGTKQILCLHALSSKYFCHIKFILHHFSKDLGICNQLYFFHFFYILNFICVAFRHIEGHSPVTGSISICIFWEAFKFQKSSCNFIPCSEMLYIQLVPINAGDAMKFLFVLIIAKLRVNLWGRTEYRWFQQ